MKNHSQYAISGGHQLTIDAAENILSSGGNAVDAAISAYWMCMVAEPFMASAGAGGFAMIREPNRKTTAVDFFCQTPKSKLNANDLEFFPITVDFGSTTEDFYVGMGSVAVPGAIAMLFELHNRWATIPMKELIQPAITMSKQGVVLDPFQSYECELLESIYKLSATGQRLFVNPDGSIKSEGERVTMNNFASFAEAIASEGPDLFYRGEISDKISKLCSERGGHLNRNDFEQYQVNISQPFLYKWNDYIIHSNPFPSVGAMILAAILKDIEQAELWNEEFLSNSHLNSLKHIVKSNYEVKQDLTSLLSKLANFDIPITNPDYKAHKWGGTSHFNIVDRDGMAVSLSTSIGEGCGTFIEGTDMQLNNMLGELALLPNGLHSWEKDVRLQSMMCPTIVTDDNQNLQMLIGSGGAGRIPFAMAQTINNHIGYGLNLQKAIASPRIIYDGSQFQIESGFEKNDVDELDNYWNAGSLYFGGTHAISVLNDIQASGDQRRYGKSILK